MITEDKAISLLKLSKDLISTAENLVANPDGAPPELLDCARAVVATRDDVHRILRSRGIDIE